MGLVCCVKTVVPRLGVVRMRKPLAWISPEAFSRVAEVFYRPIKKGADLIASACNESAYGNYTADFEKRVKAFGKDMKVYSK